MDKLKTVFLCATVEIILIVCVGVGFAIAYRLSGNNLIVAYSVNLPNAFVTYMLKFEQFPVMELLSMIASIITLIAIIVICIVLRACTKKGTVICKKYK